MWSVFPFNCHAFLGWEHSFHVATNRAAKATFVPLHAVEPDQVNALSQRHSAGQKQGMIIIIIVYFFLAYNGAANYFIIFFVLAQYHSHGPSCRSGDGGGRTDG